MLTENLFPFRGRVGAKNERKKASGQSERKKHTVYTGKVELILTLDSG